MEKLSTWIHYFAEICYILNPFITVFTVILWLKLSFMVRSRMDDALLKFSSLEHQIDCIIGDEEGSLSTRQHIAFLRKIYNE